MNNQLTKYANLSQVVSELNSSLNSIKPINYSKEVQIITYTLIATVIAGLFVYHYINKDNAI